MMRLCLSVAILFAPMSGGISAASAQEPNCINPMSQVEMTYCAGFDYDKADKELNRVWPEYRKAMKQRDAYQDEPFFKKSADLLLEAQRAWITYRDAHCDGYALQAAGGTAQPMLGSACRADLTRKRIEELKSLIQG